MVPETTPTPGTDTKFTRNRYVIYTTNSKTKKLIEEEHRRNITENLCESFSGILVFHVCQRTQEKNEK